MLGDLPKVTQKVSGCTVTEHIPAWFLWMLITGKFCCLLVHGLFDRGQLRNVSFLLSLFFLSISSSPLYAEMPAVLSSTTLQVPPFSCSRASSHFPGISNTWISALLLSCFVCISYLLN